MGDLLRARLRQSRFDSPRHEAVLALLVASAEILARLDQACARHDLTRGQYNVLRILRGAHPRGYPRGEIARRLIDRAPDVTRLIERLRAAGLVERAESPDDRRLVVTRITRRGLLLLERMRGDIAAVDEEIARRLTPEEAGELARLCERLLDPPEATT
jgi:DNA-binding MarR family transcriptional regulator